MFRQIVAASAVALMTTGAIAQDDAGVQRAPAVDAVQPDVDRLRMDFDARFADYDERMEDYERRLLEMDERVRALEERGVERAGTEMGEDVIDAAQPEQDVIE
jgi:hypothetical protein